jgi:hypothetical protein
MVPSETTAVMRAWVAKAMLLLLGCVVALAVCEVGLRLLGFESKRKTRTVYEGRHRVGIPNFQFYKDGERRLPNRVVYNNLGFHDRDREATSERHRVLVLGDSFVAGEQVSIDELFTSRLEDLLVSSGHDAELINAGQSGTGAAHQYALWNEYLKERISHDQILLALYIGNEIHDNSEVLTVLRDNPPHGAFLRSDGSVYVNPHPEPTKRRFKLKHDSALVRALRKRVKLRWPSSDEGEFNIDSTVSSHAEAWRDSVVGTLELIRRWNREARAEGRGFSVVILPTSGGERTLTVHEMDFLERLRMLARAEGLALQELDFSRFDPYELFSFDGKALGHFNFEGHRQAAIQLHAWLVERQSIPAR